MKKAILMLAAFGMIAASANAQSKRLNRTTTKPAANTTVISAEENQKREEAAKQDGARFPASGANGTDGSINDRANSGTNRSSSVVEDHGSDPNAGYSAPAQPATNTNTNSTR